MRTNFQMTDQNITMVQGDTLSFNVVIKNQYGNPVTVAGAYFHATNQIGSILPEISVYLGHGITQNNGVLTVRIAPSMTDDLEGFFYYDMSIDVQNTSGNNDTYTLLKGMLQIEPAV